MTKMNWGRVNSNSLMDRRGREPEKPLGGQTAWVKKLEEFTDKIGPTHRSYAFASSLLDGARIYGDLTLKQAMAADRMIREVEPPRPNGGHVCDHNCITTYPTTPIEPYTGDKAPWEE